MFPLFTDCQAPGSKTTPFGIGPIPQASPYLEWGPGASSLAPNRTGPHSCSTNPGYQGLPQEWGPGPMPPRSWIPAPSPTSAPSSPPKSHLPPGEGHSLLRSPDFGPLPQGLRVGRGAAVQGSFAEVSLQALALGGGAPGFSLGLRGARSMPPAQPRVGARAPGGL